LAVDDKNRLSIPSEIRKSLDPERDGDKFFLVVGVNHRLWLYPDRAYETLVSKLNQPSLLTNGPVESIQPEDARWKISAGSKSDQFDAVIVAVPAPAAARILSICSSQLSAELAAISYSSSITVGLGYDRDVRESLPPGFGFLVPRSEGKRLLAATFVHNKFPHRAPDDRALLRCFFAGLTLSIHGQARASWLGPT